LRNEKWKYVDLDHKLYEGYLILGSFMRQTLPHHIQNTQHNTLD